MVADRERMFRRQSLLTYVGIGAVIAVVSSISPTAGHILLQGWAIILLVAVYIFATRTFRLTEDRWFLFIGAVLPGVILTRIFEVLSMREFGIFPEFHDGLSIQLRNASRLMEMGVILLAPLLSRAGIHRYLLTASSFGVGIAMVSVLVFSDWIPMCLFEGSQGPCGKILVDIGICAGFLLAAGELLRTVISGHRRKESSIDREKAVLMLVAVAFFLMAAILSAFYLNRYSWIAWADAMLVIAGWYLVLEILTWRGLELPIQMISRSRSQLEAAISAAVDAIVVSDLNGIVIAMNMRFRIFCGLGVEVERDAHVSMFINRAIRSAIKAGHLRQKTGALLESPGAEAFERFEMKDGRIIEMSSVPFMFEGRIDGRVWTFRDVSQRERTTAQLERTSWRLDNILSAAREGIFEMNLDSGALWVHRNWSKVVGCSTGEVPSNWSQWSRMIHPDDLALIQREIRHSGNGSRECGFNFRMASDADGWRWFSSTGRIDLTESSEGGNAWILNGVLRDVTAERARDAEIRRQRSMMEALVQNMPLGAFVKEIPSRRYVIWNSTLSKLSGLIPGQVVGRRDVEIFGPDVAARIRKADDEVTGQGVSVVLENSWIGDSSGRNVRVRMVPVIDSDRTVTLIIGIVEDVTQQQQIERLAHQSRSMEALGRLAGGIAHDFNNILQVIIGAADSLKVSKAVRGAASEDLDHILDAGDRAMSLIRQLLTFSRQESSTREAVDIGKAASELLKMLQRLIGADIRVDLDAPVGRYSVFAERSRIEQVIMNLTVNAVDAMPYGGTLAISVTCVDADDPSASGHPKAASGPWISLAVRDSGIGIPREVLEHVWEPFFSTKEVGKGTGLGLSTVYGVVESLGGFVTVASEMGRGTEFKVFLPQYQPESQRRGEAILPGLEMPEKAGQPVVLLVRADAAALAADAATLGKAGMKVITASSGPEAMQRLWDADESGGINLMVLDLVISGMGGRDICDRYLMDHSKTPVLFVQGPSSTVVSMEYLAEVGGRVISSPYSSRQFLLEVRALLGGSVKK
ncbi:MAG TPA: ATP-binding protein [Myxococcota bacterium]|nr:ATP-binding protein [Myxococcota bacterium]